jgi:hypothetical protein
VCAASNRMHTPIIKMVSMCLVAFKSKLNEIADPSDDALPANLRCNYRLYNGKLKKGKVLCSIRHHAMQTCACGGMPSPLSTSGCPSRFVP